MIRQIFDQALTSHLAYTQLRNLCKNIGPRLTGSGQAAVGIEYVHKLLKTTGCDSIYNLPVMVRNWERGEKETASMTSSILGTNDLHICALGGSIATPSAGIQGQIIMVDSLSQLKKLGRQAIEGHIVFFNRHMDPRFIRTFNAYGRAADQRTLGASEAAKYGAIGVIIRSLTLADNLYPHTGVLRYDTAITRIPAVAIATRDADLLSQWLKKDPSLRVSYTTHCSENQPVPSFNVVGEIKGSLYPDQVILVGGHIDSWDLGEGAQDDGIGCMQSIEALRILLSLGYKPNYTIRCVIFIDEEIGQAGGRAYAAWSLATKQKHRIAIELDAGGLLPLGFGMSDKSPLFEAFQKWQPLMLPYGLYNFQKGGGGVDIGFLSGQNVPLMSLLTDSQRYFDYHHSGLDVFENVNEREMQLGSAAVSSIIYLLDR
ncbi:MAG: M20/M25/M40 family metallo-hydrolase [Bacteroidetes bacterium]|nr:M20/M25/M40 family metallo-hydrolase [Bacteroidota bacterium]